MSTINNDYKVSIKGARNDANLSRKKLAEMLNVCEHTVKNWEEGNTAPNIQQFLKIAEITQTPVGLLCCNKTLPKQ